jgi:ABC-type uncharacterized transport system ATPase subunit
MREKDGQKETKCSKMKLRTVKPSGGNAQRLIVDRNVNGARNILPFIENQQLSLCDKLVQPIP